MGMVLVFVLWKELKRRKTTKEEEKADTATERKKREKKVYDFPGQKRDPPEEVLFCCSILHFYLVLFSLRCFL